MYLIILLEFTRNSIYKLIKTLVPLKFAGIARGRNFLERRRNIRSSSCTCGKRLNIPKFLQPKTATAYILPTKQDFSKLFVPHSPPWALGERWNKFSYFCYFGKVVAHENSSNFDRFQLHSTEGNTLRAILTQKLELRLTPRFYYGGGRVFTKTVNIHKTQRKKIF